MASDVGPSFPGGVGVCLLGGVDVVVDATRLALGGSKPRALLAVLALQPDVTVGVDRLVDDVWGESAPPSVRSSVQVHVSNLRRALAGAGLDGLVQTRGSGYAFTGSPEIVDVHRFSECALAARAAFTGGDLERAAVSARAARTLWRGAPLAGLGDAPFAASRAVALESDFLALIDLYADIEIALGRPADVVGELEQVVAVHPYRESSWARLALALYRSGRQVDALDRLHAVRRVLADDLGLDPSPDVVALELAVLHHDPALLGGAAPASRSADTVPPESRLPPSRRLVGRDDLVGSIADAVGAESLVTVVGPGGVGKTSVAVAAAAALAGTHGVSARFVDLSALDATTGVLPAILAAVGGPTADGSIDVDTITAALAAHDAPLLVLDNCEHLVDDVAAVVTALRSSLPRLRVLATSRTPIAVPGETIVMCEPLLPDDAVELFVGRAQAADRTYVATDDERAAISTLVGVLDRLPLAIELFSARVRTRSAVDLLARLGSDLLDTSWRSGTTRQRSLRDVVAWSYELLDDDARSCLRRLSVFGGSASADAIRRVCRPADDATLEHLVACSLVVADRTATGMRYRLLDTVRAYAAEQLEQHAERDEVRAAFVGWIADWAASIAIALESPEPAGAIDQLDAEVANVRVAHGMALTEPGGAARLLAEFGPKAFAFSFALPEGLAWARDAAGDPAASRRDRMVLLIVIGRLTNVGTVERRALLQEAVELAVELGDQAAEAAAYAELALVELDVTERSIVASAHAIELAVAAGRPVTLAWALNVALTSLLRRRRFDELDRLFSQHCLVGTRRFGVHEGHVLFQWGRAAMLRSDLDVAAARFAAAEDAARRSRSLAGQSTAGFGLAEVDRRAGRFAAAYDRYCRCLPVDLVLEPGESGLVRMMIVWMANELGLADVAEEHAAVLAEELSRERAGAGPDDELTMLEACAAGAETFVALGKGMRSRADESMRWAIRAWAASDSWDVVADLIGVMSAYQDDGTCRERLAALSSAVWRGDVSLDHAVGAALATPPVR